MSGKSGEYPVNFQEVVKADAFLEPDAARVIRNVSSVPLLESGLTFSPFTRSSELHGRSMEDPSCVVFTGEPLTDSHGDTYTSFTIKGANCSLPSANYYEIEPSCVRVNGMLDASTFERCKTVSKVLREAGVLTEWPILHMRPKKFPDGEKDIPLQAFRQMIYENYVIRQQAFGHDVHRGRRLADNLDAARVVGEGLSELQFSVMYRAGLSPIRLWELKEHGETGTLPYHLSKTITALQTRKPEHFGCWPELEALDPESEYDQIKYLEEILPKIMGENLARFHNANCYHKYLHGGNWTLAGEIVDLDSVRCDTLDKDEPRDYTVLDKLDEAFAAYDSIVSMSSFVYLMGFRDKDPYEKKKLPADEMWDMFKSSYFAERYTADVSKLEKVILLSHFSKLPEDMFDWEDPDTISITNPKLIDFVCSFNWKSKDDSLAKKAKTANELVKGLTPIVAEAVFEFLNTEIESGWYIPGWLEEKKIIAEETSRLIAMLLRVQDPEMSAV